MTGDHIAIAELGTHDPRLSRLRRLAYLLDSSIAVPGTSFRFGIDAIIGLVPGLGDILGGLLSLYIIAQASRLGAPRPLLVRMAWNVALDVFVGEVPIVGDLFDAGYKTNLRNLALLDEYMRHPAEVRRSSRRRLALVVAGLLLLAAGAIVVAALLVHWLVALAR